MGRKNLIILGLNIPYDQATVESLCVRNGDISPTRDYPPESKISAKAMSTREKKELGQYPAILNSHLVNNPFFFIESRVASTCRRTRLSCWCTSIERITSYMLDSVRSTSNSIIDRSGVQFIKIGKRVVQLKSLLKGLIFLFIH